MRGRGKIPSALCTRFRILILFMFLLLIQNLLWIYPNVGPRTGISDMDINDTGHSFLPRAYHHKVAFCLTCSCSRLLRLLTLSCSITRNCFNVNTSKRLGVAIEHYPMISDRLKVGKTICNWRPSYTHTCM